MRGLPFEPTHGRSVTAAEMILSGPVAERRDVKKLKRFAASEDEYGLPAPVSLGYSYLRPSVRDQRDQRHQAHPVNVNPYNVACIIRRWPSTETGVTCRQDRKC